MEKIDRVLREQRITGQQADIGVQSGGLYVIVARANVDVASQTGRFLANNKRNLGVRLETGDAESDVRPDSLQFRSPVQIAFLVKAGFDFRYEGLHNKAARLTPRQKNASWRFLCSQQKSCSLSVCKESTSQLGRAWCIFSTLCQIR